MSINNKLIDPNVLLSYFVFAPSHRNRMSVKVKRKTARRGDTCAQLLCRSHETVHSKFDTACSENPPIRIMMIDKREKRKLRTSLWTNACCLINFVRYCDRLHRDWLS